MSTIQIHTNDIYYRYKSNLNIDYTKYDINTDVIISLLDFASYEKKIINTIEITNYKFLYFISTIILKFESFDYHKILIDSNYLVNVCKNPNGFIILNKLDNIIKNHNINLELLFKPIMWYATFNTFIYYYNNVKTDIDNLIYHTRLNNDYRIFKFLISKYFSKNNSESNILNVIDIILKKTNRKILFKRINYILQFLKMNSVYFEYILYKIHDNNILIKFNKLYDKYHTLITMKIMIQQIIMRTQEDENIKHTILTIYNNMKNTDMKCLFNIAINLCSNKDKLNLGKIDDSNDKRLIKENKYDFINILFKYNIFTLLGNSYIVDIFKYITHNDINNFIQSIITTQCLYLNDSKLFFFSKFILIDINSKYIKLLLKYNKLLSLLRIKMKQQYNKKIKKHYDYHYKLINAIRLYEPNNIPVLKNGSLYYQYTKSQFPVIKNIPPMFTNSNMIVNVIPKYVFPPTNIFKNNIVYATYIEEYDIYLVHDFFILNTTMKERYDYLCNNHNMKDLKQFIETNKNKTIWFPLVSIK